MHYLLALKRSGSYYPLKNCSTFTNHWFVPSENTCVRSDPLNWQKNKAKRDNPVITQTALRNNLPSSNSLPKKHGNQWGLSTFEDTRRDLCRKLFYEIRPTSRTSPLSFLIKRMINYGFRHYFLLIFHNTILHSPVWLHLFPVKSSKCPAWPYWCILTKPAPCILISSVLSIWEAVVYDDEISDTS